MSCSALLFIQLFSNLQIGVGKNHHPTSVSTWRLKAAARKYTAYIPISDDDFARLKLQYYLSNSHLVFPPPHSISINLLVTLFAESYELFGKLSVAFTILVFTDKYLFLPDIIFLKFPN